jgi:coat protein Gp5
MANQLLTTSMITREILRVLSEKLTFLKHVNRSYDDRYAVQGAKIGDTLQIRVPTHATIRTGRIMQPGNLVDQVVPLTVATQTGVDWTFSSAEMALDIDEFSKRYMAQGIADLAVGIEQTILAGAITKVYNQYGDPTTGLTLNKVLNGNKILTDNLAPSQPRYLMTNTAGTIQAVQDTKSLFNSQPLLADQYEEGIMARAAGFDWFESTVMPIVSRGAGTGYLVNGVAPTGSSLPVDTGTGAIPAGNVFTIAGVNAVHPQTKADLGYLQPFVVTTAYAGGAGNISIAPSISVTGPTQNVTAAPVDNTALTLIGAASTTYGVNLGFQRDFLAFVTADLPMPPKKDASRMEWGGISLRVIQDFDTVNDMFLTRVDILYGYNVIRPELAVRLNNNPALLT